MADLPTDVAALAAEFGFAGAVSLSRGAQVEYEGGFGAADRAHDVPWTAQTVFATASGTKSFTAATVLALVDESVLSLSAPARTWLGDDLPLVDDGVTIAQLLAHRSGMGDYVDEEAAEELPLKVPVQALSSTPAYVPALDGFPAKFAPDERFSYCNSGYVVLALIAERASGTPFEALVGSRVFEPAGMTDSGFLRSDALPGRAAIGYLEDGRTNVFALPVVGSGDGGAYTTLADLRRFWLALLGGRIVASPDRLTTPSSVDTGHPFAYGYGLWLQAGGPQLLLEGCDHGVSLRSIHDPSSGRTMTVASNTTDGAFGLARRVRALYLGDGQENVRS